jgi:hypothetical protein
LGRKSPFTKWPGIGLLTEGLQISELSWSFRGCSSS